MSERGRGLIMVVEDDADVADVIAAALEDQGYTVIVAANGHEALSKLRATARLPRLILFDLMMPRMDGWQFRAAQKAEPMLADVPLVLLSANGETRQVAEQLGVFAWLKKPIDLRALLNVVARGSDA